jgi:hypothetical protein
MSRTFFAAGNPSTEKLDTRCGQFIGAQNGILKIRVARIDDEVARLQVREQFVDHRVDGGACGHEQHDGARAPERRGERLDIGGIEHFALPAGFFSQGLDFCRIFVVTDYGETVVGDIQ